MSYAPKGRGFFAIGSECFKYHCNVGTLYRSAFAFGASYIFSMGLKPDLRGDVPKTYKHVPYFHYRGFEEFYQSKPKGAKLIGVEITDKAHSIHNFVHPESAIYLLGNECGGLSELALSKCDYVIYIPSTFCLNVSVAGSIVMYDRQLKGQKS